MPSVCDWQHQSNELTLFKVQHKCCTSKGKYSDMKEIELFHEHLRGTTASGCFMAVTYSFFELLNDQSIHETLSKLLSLSYFPHFTLHFAKEHVGIILLICSFYFVNQSEFKWESDRVDTVTMISSVTQANEDGTPPLHFWNM